MKLYFDTSALIKFYHSEIGTEFITDLILNQENEKWILEIAKLEFASALFRRYRMKELDKTSLHEAFCHFENNCSLFNIEPMGKTVVDEADLFIKKYGYKYGLRALDALHLAAFSILASDGFYFVCADETLCRIADEIGYLTLNPEKSENPN